MGLLQHARQKRPASRPSPGVRSGIRPVTAEVTGRDASVRMTLMVASGKLVVAGASFRWPPRHSLAWR